MSAAKDRPVSKPATKQFRDNFDRIFWKKKTQEDWLKAIDREIEDTKKSKKGRN